MCIHIAVPNWCHHSKATCLGDIGQLNIQKPTGAVFTIAFHGL